MRAMRVSVLNLVRPTFKYVHILHIVIYSIVHIDINFDIDKLSSALHHLAHWAPPPVATSFRKRATELDSIQLTLDCAKPDPTCLMKDRIHLERGHVLQHNSVNTAVGKPSHAHRVKAPTTARAISSARSTTVDCTFSTCK
jgi:hypothetical protein